MQSVLNEMQDLLEFHEAIEMLKNLIEREKELSEETKKFRKNKLFGSSQRVGTGVNGEYQTKTRGILEVLLCPKQHWTQKHASITVTHLI